ncbi:MAG TPA: glycosyltransferase family 2 protein [Pyrinomonadaceae bacterium]|nr:glycosyltransferase family 2 protein [Pyrinomonadaceae bacterium]
MKNAKPRIMGDHENAGSERRNRIGLLENDLARNLIKIPTLFRKRTSALSIREIPRLALKTIRVLRTDGMRGLKQRIGNKIDLGYEYVDWVNRYDTLTFADRAAMRRHIERLAYRPLISLIMPTYNTPEKWLRLAIDSVKKQLYPNWELCIADDASSKIHVRKILQENQAKDPRIKLIFRKNTGHIAAASNSALEMATGEFVALLDHDDQISEHALYMVAVELNAHSDADLIYSDEDKIDERGCRYEPYFKPDWNPDLFLAQNYLCHLLVCRTRIVEDVAKFREGYEGSQDWDLAMRISERIPAHHIRHIPHVLYHWRAIPGSAARRPDEKKYVREAQQRTLESHFDRIGLDVAIVPVAGNYWRIKYSLQHHPLVTLIIPTRNLFELLERCVESVFHKTTYPNFELIIVDNQSDDTATLNYFTELEKDRGVKVLHYDAPFNFSAINNFAVRHARGGIIGLINNDLEVITPDWLNEMVGHAARPEIGAVGAKLYYPDNRIQHAGVTLGLNGNPGVAGHRYEKQPRSYAGQASRAVLCQNLSAVTAACLVLRRHVFEEVGGFDEKNLTVAFNDVDLCLRIEEKGYRNVWTPYAELYHYESASRGLDDTPDKLERSEKECDYMRRRWGELLAHDPAHNPNLALERGIFSLAAPPRITKPWLLAKPTGI